MMRAVIYGVLALTLAGLLGWNLAETEPPRMGFDGSELPTLPATDNPGSGHNLEQDLAALYERQAWSARAPQSEESGHTEPSETEGPEGLDRFRLLGILRVTGSVPEALLRDQNAKDNTPAVFRAQEGELLKDSEVTLAAIGQQQISLEQAGESKTLFLFPRRPMNGTSE
ncbi:hypothetical protein [Marinobacter piscensis]|uniref:hypothetical protein n=1 Tax=Marinobacter piscensis TaxID=1562308 RepID=UPI00119F29E6|nr:hypothetical protein [Marinobacter piscensis]